MIETIENLAWNIVAIIVVIALWYFIIAFILDLAGVEPFAFLRPKRYYVVREDTGQYYAKPGSEFVPWAYFIQNAQKLTEDEAVRLVMSMRWVNLRTKRIPA